MTGVFLFFYHLTGTICLPFVLFFSAMHTLFKPEKRFFYLERFSLKLPKKIPKVQKRIWLHAVSLGEVLSCEPLIRELNRRHSDVWLSTGTRAGFETARKRFDHIDCFYFPFDFQFAVTRFLKRINPDVVLLCELEIWPSFVWSLHRRGIPLYLVSGRMVQKDFRRYKRFKWFFSRVFGLFSALFMQNEIYAQRMRALCRHPRIEALGSLKFDTPPEWEPSDRTAELMPRGDNLVAVSTHRGDEAWIIRAFAVLRVEFPALRLVLVPRHPVRRGEITRLLDTRDLSYTLRTENKPCGTPVFIVDSIGDMPGVYEKAGLVIMGGSFSRRVGGHNILEPALYGKCILCGTHMENFEEIHSLFIREGALVSTTRRNLIQDLRTLLSSNRKTVEMGKKAYEVAGKNRGASKRICNRILPEPPGNL